MVSKSALLWIAIANALVVTKQWEYITEAQSLISCYDDAFTPSCPDHLRLVGDIVVGNLPEHVPAETWEDPNVKSLQENEVTESELPSGNLSECYDPNNFCQCDIPSSVDRMCFWRQSDCSFEPSYKIDLSFRCDRPCVYPFVPDFTVCVNCGCVYPNQSIEIGEHQGGITVPFGYIYTPRFPYSYYRFGEYSETFLIEEPDSTALQLTAYNMSIWKSTKAGCGEEDHYLKIKSYSQNKVLDEWIFCGEETFNLTIIGDTVTVTFNANADGPMGNENGCLIYFRVIDYDVPVMEVTTDLEVTEELTTYDLTTDITEPVTSPGQENPEGGLSTREIILVSLLCFTFSIAVVLCGVIMWQCKQLSKTTTQSAMAPTSTAPSSSTPTLVRACNHHVLVGNAQSGVTQNGCHRGENNNKRHVTDRSSMQGSSLSVTDIACADSDEQHSTVSQVSRHAGALSLEPNGETSSQLEFDVSDLDTNEHNQTASHLYENQVIDTQDQSHVSGSSVLAMTQPLKQVDSDSMVPLNGDISLRVIHNNYGQSVAAFGDHAKSSTYDSGQDSITTASSYHA